MDFVRTALEVVWSVDEPRHLDERALSRPWDQAELRRV
jgi:hypothetical protein